LPVLRIRCSLIKFSLCGRHSCYTASRTGKGDDVATSWRVVEGFSVGLVIPDLWQQEAIRALQQGKDVVVQARNGSGKTYIFEPIFLT